MTKKNAPIAGADDGDEIAMIKAMGEDIYRLCHDAGLGRIG